MIIKIKNFRLKTIIGIYEWEKSVQRDLIINAIIETNDNSSAKTDDIKNAIDYENITKIIRNIVENEQFGLVEALNETILNKIMEDKRIKKCTLEIDKIGALKDLESFAIIQTKEQK